MKGHWAPMGRTPAEIAESAEGDWEGGTQLEGIRKGEWRSKIGVGVAIGLGIERPRDGIRTRETGYRNCIVAVLTQFGGEVWAVHEGQTPTRTGIDSDPDSDPDPDSANDLTDQQPLSGGDT
jgi:hypothetical protein